MLPRLSLQCEAFLQGKPWVLAPKLVASDLSSIAESLSSLPDEKHPASTDYTPDTTTCIWVTTEGKKEHTIPARIELQASEERVGDSSGVMHLLCMQPKLSPQITAPPKHLVVVTIMKQ